MAAKRSHTKLVWKVMNKAENVQPPVAVEDELDAHSCPDSKMGESLGPGPRTGSVRQWGSPRAT